MVSLFFFFPFVEDYSRHMFSALFFVIDYLFIYFGSCTEGYAFYFPNEPIGKNFNELQNLRNYLYIKTTFLQLDFKKLQNFKIYLCVNILIVGTNFAWINSRILHRHTDFT